GRRLHRLRPRDRLTLLGPVPGLSVRALLVGLERTEPPAVPGPAVRLAWPPGRTGQLRQASSRGVHGDQGREPTGEGCDRGDLTARERQGNRAAPDPLAREVRGARGQGGPAAEGRRVGAPPGPPHSG